MSKIRKKKIVKKAKKLVKKKLIKKAKIFAKKKDISKALKKPAKSQKKINKKNIVLKKRVAKPKKVVRLKKIKKIQKVSKSRALKKSAAKESVAEFSGEKLFKARIKVIGIGGGGGSIVSEIGKSLEKATFMVADTDIRALKKRSGIKYFWFGEKLTHGLGTGVDIELGKKAAEESKEKMADSFKDQDIVIFIASLGGGLGSSATQVFSEYARKFGCITVGIFTMPFKFEGANKYRIAQNALKLLKQSLNVSLVIPNEKIFKIIDANTPITNAFSTVNKSLIESLESLIDLIYSPGIINIDFADLRTILKGVGNNAFLNTVEESGKDRAEKICKRILINPLLQNNAFEAEKILFNIAGSENLSMFEVEKISRFISELNPKSKIIFGISKSPKLKHKIKTTILMTGGGSPEKMVADQKFQVVETAPVNLAVSVKSPEPMKAVAVALKKPLEAKPEQVILERKKEIIVKKPVIVKEKSKTNILKVKKKKLPVKKERAVGDKKAKLIPVLQIPREEISAAEQRKMIISQTDIQEPAKKAIRRSGLEIKKAEEKEEKRRVDQEKEWEIPAFLRRVKFKQ